MRNWFLLRSLGEPHLWGRWVVMVRGHQRPKRPSGQTPGLNRIIPIVIICLLILGASIGATLGQDTTPEPAESSFWSSLSCPPTAVIVVTRHVVDGPGDPVSAETALADLLSRRYPEVSPNEFDNTARTNSELIYTLTRDGKNEMVVEISAIGRSWAVTRYAACNSVRSR